MGRLRLMILRFRGLAMVIFGNPGLDMSVYGLRWLAKASSGVYGFRMLFGPRRWGLLRLPSSEEYEAARPCTSARVAERGLEAGSHADRQRCRTPMPDARWAVPRRSEGE